MSIRLQQAFVHKHTYKQHMPKQLRDRHTRTSQLQQNRWLDVTKHLPSFSVLLLYLKVTDEVREGSPFLVRVPVLYPHLSLLTQTEAVLEHAKMHGSYFIAKICHRKCS